MHQFCAATVLQIIPTLQYLPSFLHQLAVLQMSACLVAQPHHLQQTWTTNFSKWNSKPQAVNICRRCQDCSNATRNAGWCLSLLQNSHQPNLFSDRLLSSRAGGRQFHTLGQQNATLFHPTDVCTLHSRQLDYVQWMQTIDEDDRGTLLDNIAKPLERASLTLCAPLSEDGSVPILRL